MLETRPEIHRDRADLKFDRYVPDAVTHENRDLDDQVQALVAVGFRIGDVVLALDHPKVRLAGEHLGDSVRVGNEAAGDTYSSDVEDVLRDVVDRQRDVQALSLSQDAVR